MFFAGSVSFAQLLTSLVHLLNTEGEGGLIRRYVDGGAIIYH